MRINQDGMSLWFGTTDAPAPEGIVTDSANILLTVAVQPPDASNQVKILYRIDGGPVQALLAKWSRNDLVRKVQYFRAQFPPLRAGDKIEYSAICRCAGRQIPSAAEAERLASSFRIAGGEKPALRQATLLARPEPQVAAAPSPNGTIRYLGTVGEIVGRVDIDEAFADLRAGRVPAVTIRSIQRGTIEVRPIGAEGRMSSGTFDVTVEDKPDEIHGYRLLIAGELTDPCQAIRNEVRRLSDEIFIGERDGVRTEILNRLRGQLEAKSRELDSCIEGAGLRGVNFGSPQRMFRSMDLFRTAVENVRVDDLQLLVRVLTSTDVTALNQALGTNLSTFFPYAELREMLSRNVPDNIKISSVGTRSGHVRIKFTYTTGLPIVEEIDGSMEVEVEPSLSYDFRELLTMRLVEFDLEGIGEVAELFFNARKIAERAVLTSQTQLNSQLANNMRQLFDRGGTATLLSAQVTSDGVHASVAVGFLLGVPADPCQAIRDEMRRLIDEISSAEHEDRPVPPGEIVGKLRGQLEAKGRELQGCRGQAPIPEPEPTTGIDVARWLEPILHVMASSNPALVI